MTDPQPRTLPRSVRQKALQAIAKLTAWNDAVLQARRMEALAGCPGRYEYDLIATTNATWSGMRLGGHTLDLLEGTAQDQGWSAHDFYHAVGVARPALIPENPQVWNWRKGDR